MKQCVYSVILMLGLVLWLVSCTDDSINEPYIPEENIPTGTGNIFSLAMRIPLPEDYTYTRASGGVEIGSIEEILIDEVRMVLYNGGIAQYSLDLDIHLEPDNDKFKVTGDDVYHWATDGSRIFIQTIARQFERSSYEMLILINPNDVIKGKTQKGSLLTELDAPFDASNMYRLRTVGEGANAYQEPVYFLMLNSQGPVKLESAYFYDTPEKAEKNPAYINLERATAKISCNYNGTAGTRSTSVTPFGRFVMLLDYNNQLSAPWGNDYDIPEDCIPCPVHGCNGTFNRKTKRCSAKPYLHTYDGLGLVSDRVRYMVATDLSWEVDIVNKKSYWLRKLTHKAGGTAMEQQGDTDREFFYAEDPNFSGLSGSGATNLNTNFTYLSNANQLIPGASGSTAKRLYPQLSSYKYFNYWSWDEGDTQPVYIPENTMTESEQKRDVVTRLIFRAVLKREQFGENDTEENPTSPESIGDFFVFKGGDTNIEDYKYNNYNKDNTTFFILRPEDVAIYASASSTENIHIYLRDGILEAISQFKTDNPGFDFSNWENEGPAQSTNLSFYKNGEIYYEVPIEHFSVAEAQGAGKYGRFGVVRNNWYKLNIENMISIGAPIMPVAKSEFIETATRSATPETKSNSNILIRNQSIIF